jgi:7-carboxy-7-deazaguanine synthase (Cx14CxxC type)
MSYAAKEIFYTLQGEGAQAGRAAVFCRFAGCNLWSGREADRATALCRFCDTDFVGVTGVGGGNFASAEALAAAIEEKWPANSQQRFVVCTGGEPLLQLDSKLIAALHARSFEIAVETNGTLAAPGGPESPGGLESVDWLCVSPKAGTRLVQQSGDELKLIYPQTATDPADFEELSFRHFFLQPMDGPDQVVNTRLALSYCLDHPRWRLSLQIHKLLGIS